ncbi:MAG: glycosyltransferase family protein [Pseudomonas sp.]
MRVLVLTATQRQPDLATLYAHLGRLVDLDLHVLDKERQRNLRRTLAPIDPSVYQRILLDLPFKHVYRQAAFLSGLPGLLIYEEDACQNYLPTSRWQGMFSRFYRRLPQARILVTGASVARRLTDEGFDVRFMPKGFDPSMLFFEPGERDIELGFIGRTASAAYTGRKELLERLAACEPLQMLRAEPGEPYRKMLNRIRYFISADVGFGEYMAKNFEAMACGCVLLAWRQGSEEPAIGLEEGRQLLLYSDLNELRGQLQALRADPVWAQGLADAGRSFVDAHLGYPRLASQLAALLAEPWPVPVSAWRALWSRLQPF